jgi:hypothetical protein
MQKGNSPEFILQIQKGVYDVGIKVISFALSDHFHGLHM